MKVYISAPITGQPNGNKEAFAEAERKLTELGIEVVNPHKICANIPEGSDWEDYMYVCLPALQGCDALYILEGFEPSYGVKTERVFAKINEMFIIYTIGEVEFIYRTISGT